MKNVVIIGTGGFAREVYGLLYTSIGYKTDFKFKCFIEGDVPISNERNELLPGLFCGTVLDYIPDKDDVFVMGIADMEAKERIVTIVKSKGGRFLSLIHKTALVSEYAKIGEGAVLCPYSCVSCNVIIGECVIINAYSSIGHDSIIGDFTSIMSHVDITGDVHIGSHTFWGSGSRALPHSIIGSHAKIGAGSVVLRRVKDNQTVFGVPARRI